jgi:predicted SAM-dependent methyltransferase
MPPKPPLKLNLGCGLVKMPGFVNIDAEPSCKPDLVLNFITKPLPYKDEEVEEAVLFHTIEHISKRFHPHVLGEIYRVLKIGGQFILSYPEFIKCVANWRQNKQGKKDFWEATIYGRQLYPSDFHVALMYTPDFVEVLRDSGFTQITHVPEVSEPYNTIVSCVKGFKPLKKEELFKSDMERLKVQRV